MITMYYIFAGIFGSLWGSFMNVVILRTIKDESLLGRSKCSSCSRILSWFELVPIFSFLFLGKKSSCCKKNISYLYIFGELAHSCIALVLIYFFLRSEFSLFESHTYIFYFFMSSLLYALSVQDFLHREVASKLLYVFFGVSFLSLWAQTFFGSSQDIPRVYGLLLGIPFLLTYFFSKEKAMGEADVWFMFGVGASFGLIAGVSSLVLATISSLTIIMINYFMYRKSGKSVKESLEKARNYHLPFITIFVGGLCLYSFVQKIFF
jgi:prepilin signal peptidase PulO-like enzyme (type II secretory pathway)